MLSIPAVFLLAAVAAPLSPAQQRTLDRHFVCPETLPDDAARLDSITRFMDEYAALQPMATVNDRLAFRSRLMARHHCAPEGDTLQYSFPQS